MIIKRQYLKSRPVCKVTFGLSADLANDASKAHLVGEFNQWNFSATPMKKRKDGSFAVTIDLETGTEYQFRYLIDQSHWENAANADRFIPSPYGDAENSVIIV